MRTETAALVAERYGLGALTGEPVYAARGELGLIWRVGTERGSWAVKELLIDVPEADAALDVAFQRAAAASGVRLPPPVLALDGRVILRAEPHDVRVYAWEELTAEPPTAAMLGAAAAAVHRVGHPADRPVDDWFAAPLGRDAWARIPRAGAWGAELERLLPELAALDDLVTPPVGVTTCHRDLGPDNLRRAADGGVVVLDWENCGPCAPERELAAVLADTEAATEAAAEAYAAYLDAGGPARVTRPADFSTAVAVQAHLLDFYARRAVNPAESGENRERAATRLERMLARPLTRERIDRLLAEL
ncbi:phosphotransferase [Nonomuraea sp. SBT364]|uniref:phosphotransferase n=1 Tax=Nonomuraea sp. SBT364 TaxID=1580530 RepID=UPI00066BFFBF|nr:phosphotransferase [Nonomuraea sp. SBT364]